METEPETPTLQWHDLQYFDVVQILVISAVFTAIGSTRTAWKNRKRVGKYFPPAFINL